MKKTLLQIATIGLIFFFTSNSLFAGSAESNKVESFKEYNLPFHTELNAQHQLGNFTYEFRNNDQLVSASSSLVILPERGVLMIGFNKSITDFRIKNIKGQQFDLQGLQLSANDYDNREENYVSVQGFRNGIAVGEEVEILVDNFFPPGNYYDLSKDEFTDIDELRITGKSIKISLEGWNYTQSKNQLSSLSLNRIQNTSGEFVRDVHQNSIYDYILIELDNPTIDNAEINIINEYGEVVIAEEFYGVSDELKVDVSNVEHLDQYYLVIRTDVGVFQKRFSNNSLSL